MTNLNGARKLIESMRYEMGCDEFLSLAIEFWAYLQSSGMYEPDLSRASVNFHKTASLLTHELSTVLLSGFHDPLGVLLSEYMTSSKSHLGFCPTSQDVANLLSQLIGSNVNQSSTSQFYEPCCGTGSITFSSLANLIQENSDNHNPLSNVDIHVEDISPLAVKAFFVQLQYFLSFASKSLGRSVYPKSVNIECRDVLSREFKGIRYQLISPDESLVDSAA